VELIAGLSTVFGCTLQGAVPYEDIAAIARDAVRAGADVIALGDTTGEATPRQVGEVIEIVRGVAGDKLRSLHLHDTRGLALANPLVGLQPGIRDFAASLAGLGGGPHAPGATGNVNTEDLVFMLESMGYETGIDLTRLIASRAVLADALPGEVKTGRAGAGVLGRSQGHRRQQRKAKQTAFERFSIHPYTSLCVIVSLPSHGVGGLLAMWVFPIIADGLPLMITEFREAWLIHA